MLPAFVIPDYFSLWRTLHMVRHFNSRKSIYYMGHNQQIFVGIRWQWTNTEVRLAPDSLNYIEHI